MLLPKFSLRWRWRRLWRRLGPSWDYEAELETLDRRYREEHRFYHTWSHIRRCLAGLDRSRRLASDPDALELALWYHDAVYDPKAPDNEMRSALLAVKAARAAGLREGFARSISVLILSTRVEDTPDPNGAGAGRPAPTGEDVELMRDIDLSVLGLPRPGYRRYELAIRREYSWVPWEHYRERRDALLRGFLARRRIFATERFGSRYEKRARNNLRWALRRLRRVPGGAARS